MGKASAFGPQMYWKGDVVYELWDEYNALEQLSRKPAVTMIESSPMDQISYGYDYSPWEKIPASTLDFARTYYPYVRFRPGLDFDE